MIKNYKGKSSMSIQFSYFLANQLSRFDFFEEIPIWGQIFPSADWAQNAITKSVPVQSAEMPSN